MYIEIPLHENYKRYLDVILSNDEKDVSSILSEMMKYHKKTAHIESFTKNEFYPIEWRVFPIEIIILIRFRYLYGHSIDFITHEVLSKFIPFLKRKEYPLTPAIKNAINKMYIQLSL